MSFDVITRTVGVTKTFLRKGTSFAKSLRCCCEDDPRKLPPGETVPCQQCKNGKAPKKVQAVISGFECFGFGATGCDDSFDNPGDPPFPKNKYGVCCPQLNKTVVCENAFIGGTTFCTFWVGSIVGGTYQNMAHSDGIILRPHCFPFQHSEPGGSITWRAHVSVSLAHGPPGTIITPSSTWWLYGQVNYGGSGSSVLTAYGADLGIPYDPFPGPSTPKVNCFFGGISLNVIHGGGLCRTIDPMVVSAV